MPEYMETRKGFRQMPEVVAAAGAEARAAWVNDPDRAERDAAAAEAARLAQAGRPAEAPPTADALAAAAVSHHAKLEAARRAALSTPAPVAPLPGPVAGPVADDEPEEE